MDSTEFTASSIVDILVPQASHTDIEDLLGSAEFQGGEELQGPSLIPSVTQRSTLYFGKSLTGDVYGTAILLIPRYLADESIPIYVVIRTPYHEEPQLKSYIDRLAIIVEAQAFSTASIASTTKDSNAQRDSSQSQSRDVIWSGPVDMAQEPVIIVQEEDEAEGRHVFFIWKIVAFLSRPRIRLQSPMISFETIVTLRSSKSSSSDSTLDNYLPSLLPASINLFGSLKGHPMLPSAEPGLSASRFSRTNSTTSDLIFSNRSLRAAQQRSFRVIPAMSARVRYSRSIGDAGKPTIIASLDIETAPFSRTDIKIMLVQLRLSEGSTEDLGIGNTLKLPMKCRPKDNQVFLFRLTPSGNVSDGKNSNPRTLDVVIDAIVDVSETCVPHIEMRWQTGVDFSTALNPTYGTPGQPMQRRQRPTSLPVPSTSTGESNQSVPTQEAASTAGAEPAPSRLRADSIGGFGVTVTFTAPKEVQVGVPFCWDMFVVNRSSTPRKFAIMVIPKRKRGDVNSHLSSSSAGGATETHSVDAFIDETYMCAMQRNSGKDVTQIISLSTDVKIGLLYPGFCRNAELKFLPLAKGVLLIEAVRVIDVVSNESMDIRDLPDIVAKERSGDE